ncbi:hypothetical protein D3C86_1896270 [compost metagenome]
MQVGEHVVDLGQRHAAAQGAHDWRKQQVFFARQAGEDAAFLGAIADAQVGDLVGGQVDGLGAMDAHRAFAGSGQAQNGSQGRGASGAIAAQQRDDLALPDAHIHAVQDMRFPVPGLQA